MVRKILKAFFKIVLGFILFLLIYVLTAFVLSRISVKEEVSAPDEIDIYLLTNGIHSDIVVPSITDQVNWFSKLDHLGSKIDTTSFNYLAFGWGDKGFYLNTPSWSELKASTALKATIGVSGTAIHATYYEKMVEDENCTKISISKEQYARLIQYLNSSFDLDSKGSFIQIETDATKSELDAFYEATGRYSLFNTCNSWTNKGLKASGQKACVWTAFQKPIFLQYD